MKRYREEICISFNIILVKFKFYLHSLLSSLYTQTFITYSLYCTTYKSMVLTRGICLIIKSFFGWYSLSLFSWPWFVMQEWYCKEKLDAGHSKGSKDWKPIGVKGFHKVFHPFSHLQSWHFNCIECVQYLCYVWCF